MSSTKSNLTSIIMQCYDFNLALRHMTYYSLANIIKYTDEKDYELIVIDNEPIKPIDDGYKIIEKNIDVYQKNDTDNGCFQSYRLGSQFAHGDVLVFIQNDVFVHEGWLPGLRYYIDKGLTDVVYPDQVPRTRAEVKESYSIKPDHPDMFKGSRDAGLMMISTKGYFKTRGWNPKIKASIIGWKDMFHAIDEAGLKWIDTRKVMITHIMAGNNLMKDQAQYDKEMQKEVDLLG